MTEFEWLTWTDPGRLLRFMTEDSGFIGHAGLPMATERQLRLFACACLEPSQCHIYTEEDILAAEDADFTASVLPHMLSCCFEDQRPETNKTKAALLRDIIGNPFRPVRLPPGRSYLTCERCGELVLGKHQQPTISYQDVVKCGKCGEGLVLSVTEPCPWLTGFIRGFAQGIYDNRDFAALPILADALEEAGCTNEEALRHCRGQERCPVCLPWRAGMDAMRQVIADVSKRGAKASMTGLVQCDQCSDGWITLRGPHVRGCWAIDCILGSAVARGKQWKHLPMLGKE